MLKIFFGSTAIRSSLVPKQIIETQQLPRKLIASSWSSKVTACSILHARSFCRNNNTTPNDKSLPKLVYIQHPLKYLRNKWDLLRLKLFWDFSFKERDFLYGSAKAAVVMAEYIRGQNTIEIFNVSTPMGFKQVARDMILSQDDPRLRLLRFRFHDIKRAIPVKIQFLKKLGTKHVLVDMFFVGMRNVHDFNPDDNIHDVLENLHKFDIAVDSGREKRASRRIIFAEIYTRFHREFTRGVEPEWSVAFYKVATFDVFALR